MGHKKFDMQKSETVLTHLKNGTRMFKMNAPRECVNTQTLLDLATKMNATADRLRETNLLEVEQELKVLEVMFKQEVSVWDYRIFYSRTRPELRHTRSDPSDRLDDKLRTQIRKEVLARMIHRLEELPGDKAVYMGINKGIKQLLTVEKYRRHICPFLTRRIFFDCFYNKVYYI